VAKFAYIHYRVTACYNVMNWRMEMRAATKIQVSHTAIADHSPVVKKYVMIRFR
jgi:hypothetical protein